MIGGDWVGGEALGESGESERARWSGVEIVDEDER